MSNLPSDSPDDEVVQTVGLSMRRRIIHFGIIGFVIGLIGFMVDNLGTGLLLIFGFAALEIVSILKAKPMKRFRLRFSIRTMLILVALISVGLGGTRLWFLWNTDIYLRGGIGIEHWLGSGEATGMSFNELAKRFNYEQQGPVLGGAVKDNPTIHFSSGLHNIVFSTTANYFTKDNKVDELREQLKTAVQDNPDLKFLGYAIKYENRTQTGPNRIAISLEPIEDGSVEELMSSKNKK